MEAIVSINSKHGLRIEVSRRNQPNKSKLAMYKPLLHLYSHLKQLYISNKIECFSYKGRCVMCGCLCHVLRSLKEKLAWATDKWLWVYLKQLYH